MTTEEHFRIFKEECDYWIHKFGLLSWEVLYRHEEIPGNMAQCSYDVSARAAVLSLAKNWEPEEPAEQRVRLIAFHEVMELFLGRLAHIAECRYCQPEEVTEATHEIIATLQNVVYPAFRKESAFDVEDYIATHPVQSDLVTLSQPR